MGINFFVSQILWVLRLVLFVSEIAAAAPNSVSAAADTAEENVTLEIIIVNNINYEGADGECRVRCEYHNLKGVSAMGTITLPKGRVETWTKLTDETAEFIHCEFFCSSKNLLIDSDLYNADGYGGSSQHTVSSWSVTEVGLFEKSSAGIESLVIVW